MALNFELNKVLCSLVVYLYWISLGPYGSLRSLVRSVESTIAKKTQKKKKIRVNRDFISTFQFLLNSKNRKSTASSGAHMSKVFTHCWRII